MSVLFCFANVESEDIITFKNSFSQQFKDLYVITLQAAFCRAWLINSRGLAKKVKNATVFSKCAIKDLGTQAIRECPKCKHRVDNSDVSSEYFFF